MAPGAPVVRHLSKAVSRACNASSRASSSIGRSCRPVFLMGRSSATSPSRQTAPARARRSIRRLGLRSPSVTATRQRPAAAIRAAGNFAVSTMSVAIAYGLNVVTGMYSFITNFLTGQDLTAGTCYAPLTTRRELPVTMITDEGRSTMVQGTVAFSTTSAASASFGETTGHPTSSCMRPSSSAPRSTPYAKATASNSRSGSTAGSNEGREAQAARAPPRGARPTCGPTTS